MIIIAVKDEPRKNTSVLIIGSLMEYARNMEMSYTKAQLEILGEDLKVRVLGVIMFTGEEPKTSDIELQDNEAMSLKAVLQGRKRLLNDYKEGI